MNASRDSLLNPTLGDDARPAAAPYSTQATFFTGFFGGPFAAVALTAINSWRLRRMGRDWPVLLACLLAGLLAIWVLHGSTPAFAPVPAWWTGTFGNNSLRYAHRLVALILVGVGYLLHRKEQRNTDVLGITRPNGWIGGGLCTLGGFALTVLLIAGMGASR